MTLTHGGGLTFIAEGQDADSDREFEPVFHLNGKPGGVSFTLDLYSAPTGPVGQRPRLVAVPRISDEDLAVLFAEVSPNGIVQPLKETSARGVSLFESVQVYSTIPVPDPGLAQSPGIGVLDELAAALVAYIPGAEVVQTGAGIPAAYTYFGQLLAHDMSFMSWNPTLGGTGGWENAETLHALDFSSLFGTAPELGPRTSPWQENEGSALGLVAGAPPGFDGASDLPRAGTPARHCSVDSRADSNLALAQMHVLMIRFHQAAAAALNLTGAAAREATVQHLQAVVLTDYLKRIIPDTVYNDVMQNGRSLIHTGSGIFLIPIEFAAACFRFGHSMVRENYVHWTIDYPPGSNTALQMADLSTLTHYTETGGGLIGGRQSPNWRQAWRHMVAHTNPTALPPTIMARPIQASLAPMFRYLDHGQFPDTLNPFQAGLFNLASKSLSRGVMVGLPSGQKLAAAAGLAGSFDVAVFLDQRRARFGTLADDPGLQANTPLWFYILAEAEELGGGKLGPLGARVVMETFHAALLAAQNPIVSVSSTGVTSNGFGRKLRIGTGAANAFSLSDVVAVANGGVD